MKYAVTNIAAFSSVPLQIVTVAGAFMFVLAIILGIESLVKYFGGQAMEGFTTVILLLLIIRESCDDESGDYRLLYC